MISATISIIIPVYNVENYVSETLDSVKNQTSLPDEVIVINDGSTDNSFNIIKNYSDLKCFKIFETKNQGLGPTRNYGISLAKSDYIYFLDSDDIIENNFIYEMRKLINQYKNPDIILFSGKTFTHKKEIDNKINLKFTIEGQFFKGDKLLTKMVQKKETLPQSSRYLTKKELWTTNNLTYPNGIAEDENLFFPLIALSNNTVVNKKTYYRYRVDRPGSITADSVKPIHVEDYLNRMLSTLSFIKLNHDLIKYDYSAWCYNLERKSLKYINLCLKKKIEISWKTIIIIFFKTKNLSFLLKIFWRILRKKFKFK
jgi:glycosyltransferase involved in cell wall biosynthesis